MDNIFRIETVEQADKQKSIEVTNNKVKDGPDLDTMTFQSVLIDIGTQPNGNPITSLALDKVDSATKAQKQDKLVQDT